MFVPLSHQFNLISLNFNLHLNLLKLNYSSFNIFLDLLVLLCEFRVFHQKVIVRIITSKLERLRIILRLKVRRHHRSSFINFFLFLNRRRLKIILKLLVFYEHVSDLFFGLKLFLDISKSSPELLRLLLVSHRFKNVAKTFEAFYEQCRFGVIFTFIQQQVCDFVESDGLRCFTILFKILAAVKQMNHMAVNILVGYVAELEEALQSRCLFICYFLQICNIVHSVVGLYLEINVLRSEHCQDKFLSHFKSNLIVTVTV